MFVYILLNICNVYELQHVFDIHNLFVYSVNLFGRLDWIGIESFGLVLGFSFQIDERNNKPSIFISVLSVLVYLNHRL